MLMSPNIRYTDSVNFVIAKGQAAASEEKKADPEEAAARAKLALRSQYPILAAKIKAHPAWKGPRFQCRGPFHR